MHRYSTARKGQNMTTDIVHVDARHLFPSDANKGHGGDVTIETYDGRSVLANVAMIRQLIPGTDKGTPFEITAFLQFCVANKYDPFRRQCYFIKFGNGPPSFVVSWTVYLDRASRHPQYDGLECGVVWDAEGEVKRGQPCDYPNNADATLIGGWARVHRKDRKHPAYVEVPLAEMQKPGGTWSSMTTTMATKTPTARALRIAFSEVLGHTYAEGEIVAEETDAAVSVPTREVRAEDTAEKTWRDVAGAVEIELGQAVGQHMVGNGEAIAGILSKLAARATGDDTTDFSDAEQWTPTVCEKCLMQLEDFGIDPEWLPGAEVDDDHTT